MGIDTRYYTPAQLAAYNDIRKSVMAETGIMTWNRWTDTRLGQDGNIVVIAHRNFSRYTAPYTVEYIVNPQGHIIGQKG